MQNNFRLLLRVRYSECDAQKVVFNARYGDYVDIAVTEYFRALFGGYNEMLEKGIDTQVVRMVIEWKSSAKFDDVLSISVATRQVGNTSFTLTVTILDFHSNRLIARAENVYVLVRAITHEKMAIGDDMREKLTQGAFGIIYNHAGVALNAD